MPQGQTLLAAQYRVAQYYLDYLRSAQRAYLQGSESAAYALSLHDIDDQPLMAKALYLHSYSILLPRLVSGGYDRSQETPTS